METKYDVVIAEVCGPTFFDVRGDLPRVGETCVLINSEGGQGTTYRVKSVKHRLKNVISSNPFRSDLEPENPLVALVMQKNQDNELEEDLFVPNPYPYPNRSFREDVENCVFVLRNNGFKKMCKYEWDSTKTHLKELYWAFRFWGWPDVREFMRR